MKKYTWDEYYDKFYDWAESTQIRNLSELTSIETADADEVGEVIVELQVDLPASNRLLHKAVEAKLAFSASDLIEFLSANDASLATAALYNSAARLTSDDMEDLYGIAEDEDIIKICSKQNLTLPEDLQEQENDDCIPDQPTAKTGFWGMLFAFVTGTAGAADHNKSRSKNCDGDCVNCPPHYGYRYGRWYYGHGHTHGCELGGNRGNGGKD